MKEHLTLYYTAVFVRELQLFGGHHTFLLKKNTQKKNLKRNLHSIVSLNSSDIFLFNVVFHGKLLTTAHNLLLKLNYRENFLTLSFKLISL